MVINNSSNSFEAPDINEIPDFFLTNTPFSAKSTYEKTGVLNSIRDHLMDWQSMSQEEQNVCYEIGKHLEPLVQKVDKQNQSTGGGTPP